MIVSHKHKFIFIKPIKVAGTSIEIALAQCCGEEDIITPITKFNPKADETQYHHPARNYREKGFFNHMPPREIEKRVGRKIWDSYFKISVVRNPWDQTVSRFVWGKKRPMPKKNKEADLRDKLSKLFSAKERFIFLKKKHIKTRKAWFQLHGSLSGKERNPFDLFIRTYRPYLDSSRFYFDSRDQLICDYHIRFEHLNEDYQELCEQLDLPANQLPKTKNKLRKKKKHYSTFYNNTRRQLVAEIFRREIEKFGYSFESPEYQEG